MESDSSSAGRHALPGLDPGIGAGHPSGAFLDYPPTPAREARVNPRIHSGDVHDETRGEALVSRRRLSIAVAPSPPHHGARTPPRTIVGPAFACVERTMGGSEAASRLRAVRASSPISRMIWVERGARPRGVTSTIPAPVFATGAEEICATAPGAGAATPKGGLVSRPWCA